MVKNCNHFVTKCGGNWMAALGMICEWNPFHLGHAWLLRELKRCYSLPVVCVMSGNFVQRGEPAVAEKRARAEMALRCGADVVFELPTVWAMASAERFARGGDSKPAKIPLSREWLRSSGRRPRPLCTALCRQSAHPAPAGTPHPGTVPACPGSSGRASRHSWQRGRRSCR